MRNSRIGQGFCETIAQIFVLANLSQVSRRPEVSHNAPLDMSIISEMLDRETTDGIPRRAGSTPSSAARVSTS